VALTGAQALLACVEDDIRRHLPEVTFGYGKHELAKHGKPPRVTWVPSTGSFGPAECIDGDNPRPLRTDVAGFEVHCWAEGDEIGRDSIAEALGHLVIAAIYRSSGRQFELHQNTRDEGDTASRGWTYIFVVTFKLAITDDEQDTATLTALPFDTSSPPDPGEMQAPGDD
jgi:hypothetical protein